MSDDEGPSGRNGYDLLASWRVFGDHAPGSMAHAYTPRYPNNAVCDFTYIRDLRDETDGDRRCGRCERAIEVAREVARDGGISSLGVALGLHAPDVTTSTSGALRA